MNAKELRQAAEKVVHQWDKHDRYRTTETDNLFFNSDGEPDEVSMANHILATVREDDDEPYDKDWGRAVSGGSCLYLGDNFSIDIAACDLEYEDRSDCGGSFGYMSLSIKTRGDFRTLCRLLSKKLKEPS